MLTTEVSNDTRDEEENADTNNDVDCDATKRDKKGCSWSRVKKALSLTKPGATPLNKTVCFLMILAMFASNYAIAFLFPLTPDMVLFFGYPEKEKGYYTGIITSGFFIGRMISGVAWGWLSDRYGRRFVLILNLILVGITCVIFGFVTSLVWAVAVRAICGVCNGVMGVCKAVLYDISDETNQAATMSSAGYAWGASLGLAPLISGFSVYPWKESGSDGFLRQFPFLIPSLIAGVVCLIPAVLLFFFMDETLVTNRRSTEEKVDAKETATPLLVISTDAKEKNNSDNYAQPHSAIDLQTPIPNDLAKGITLYGDGNKFASTEGMRTSDKYAENSTRTSCPLIVTINHTDNGESAELEAHSTSLVTGKPSRSSSCPTLPTDSPLEPDEYLQLETTQLSNANEVEKENNARKCSGCLNSISKFHVVKLMRISDVRLTLWIYTLLSWNTTGLLEGVKVWASTETSLGGLGFEPGKLGTLLGASTAVLVLLQAVSFPWMERRFGAIMTAELGGVVLIFLSTSIQNIRALYYVSPLLGDIILFSTEGIIKLCETNYYTCVALLLNNSVIPGDAGFMNGLGMMFAGITKTMSPVAGGSIYAWSISHGSLIGFPFDMNFVFMFYGLCYVALNISVSMCPPSLNSKKKTY